MGVWFRDVKGRIEVLGSFRRDLVGLRRIVLEGLDGLLCSPILAPGTYSLRAGPPGLGFRGLAKILRV